MAKPDKPNPNPLPLEQAVAHEKYLLAIQQARKDEHSSKKRKEFLLLETPGGVALITVLIGGIMASLINGCIQEGMSERQAQQTRQNNKHALELELLKERIKERSTSNKEMMELVGRVVSRTQDLAITYGPSFQLPQGDGDDEKRRRESLHDQIVEVRRSFNEAVLEWNNRRESVGYMLIFYHGSPKVADAWQELSEAVDEYRLWAANELPWNRAKYVEWKAYDRKIREHMRNLGENLRSAPSVTISSIR